MPVRKIPKNYRNLTGLLPSEKSVGDAEFESTLERDVLIYFEFKSNVKSFEVQPVLIDWIDADNIPRDLGNDSFLSNSIRNGKVIDITEIPFPIPLPTLFIRGGSSGYILDSDFEKIETLFPNSEIETIENAGHWVHAENKDGFLEALLS